MSAIAAYLHHNGAQVTGSDMYRSIFSDRLADMGIPVKIGHDQSNLKNCDYLVVSSAIDEENCELKKGKEKGIKIIHRGKLLAEILRQRKTIAVTGSHGKTSSVSILTWILECANKKPTALVGGIMQNYDSNFTLQNGDWVITEADESDGSMELLSPDILLLLNTDNDHIDFYGSSSNMIDKYCGLAKKTSREVIVNSADKVLSAIKKSVDKKIITFGTPDTYHIDQQSIRYLPTNTIFTVRKGAEVVSEINLSIPGNIFLDNFLASMVVALELGIPINKIKDAGLSFKGVKRRAEQWGATKGIRIIEDYAHHPTEIKLMLESISRWHKGRVVCVFQPHRYSRSKRIANHLAKAFLKTDYLILTDIYSAFEDPIQGIDGDYVYKEILKDRNKNIIYIPKMSEIIGHLKEIVKQNDLVVFMGAGPIGSLAKKFKEYLESYDDM